MKKAQFLISAAVVAAFAAQPALAQEGDGNLAVGEIVVTAQKRSEKLQDVPIAISAATAESLATAGVRSTGDLSFSVAGLNITRKTEATNINLRGIGTQGGSTGQDSAVATFVDGVYMPSMAGATFALNNIERIEVLKGPQGTLYGRNATGGAVNVITRDPSQQFDLNASIGYGNLQTMEGSLYVNGGLAQGVAADFAVYYRNQDKGFGKNLLLGRDVNLSQDLLLRGKFLFEIGDSTKVVVEGDWGRTQGSIGIAYRPVPTSQLLIPSSVRPGQAFGYDDYQAMGGGFYDSISDFMPLIDTKTFGGYLRVEHEMGDFTLKSITAYRGSEGFQRVEVDATPVKIVDAPLFNSEDQWTQELQLGYQKDGLSVLVGGYYMDAKSRYDPFQILGLAISMATGGVADGIRTNATQATQSYALFGQATFEIMPDTNLTIGGRYTVDKRHLTGNDSLYLAAFNPLATVSPFGKPLVSTPAVTVATYDKEKTFEKPTWRIALDHKFTPDVLGYVSYSRGFKSGVFNLTSPNDAPAAPETLDSVEVGMKSTLFDRRLRFNLAGFYYKYKNIQAFQVNGATTTLTNAASARIWGLDADFEASLAEGLTLTGSASWLDTKYGSFPVATMSFLTQPVGAPAYPGYMPGFGNYVFPDCGSAPHTGQSYCSATGNDLVNAPDFTANLALNYEVELSGGSKIGGNVAWAYNNGFYWAVDNRVKQPAFSLFNAQLVWKAPDDRYNVRVWGRNLGNKKFYASFDENGTGDIGVPAPGRSYGVSLGFDF